MQIKKTLIAAVHDVTMAAVSFIVALYLRLGETFYHDNALFVPSLLLFAGICAGVFSYMRLYNGIWRYASLQDLVAITKAVTLSLIIFVPTLFVITRLEGFPRSVPVINWMVLLLLLGGPRVIYRMLKDRSLQIDLSSGVTDARIPVLLVGVCESAIQFLRESKKKNADYKVIGLIDNDASKIGRTVHHVKVYGDIASIPKVVRRLKREGKAPQRIILADSYLEAEILENLLDVADRLGFTLSKLPNIADFNHNVKHVPIKPVVIEDLLGRPPKTPHLGRRKKLIQNKKILVTGAGGTIGGELVRQIIRLEPASITLVDISEHHLYQIDKIVADIKPALKRRTLIGDIKHYNAINTIFEQETPDIVFHAAALKHVPLVEDNLAAACLTNILGSKNIADLCVKHQVQKMVMVSTDKAVNPTSFMGATKRAAECYVQALGNDENANGTDFITVRFGNVLGSSGSVIPLFEKQLQHKGPITVTHPEMKRYFMTVPESVELVLQASTMQVDTEEKRSAIFVLDMGEQILIKDLATRMIQLAGLRPNIDVEIEYTGVRAGEKLYEELFYVYETSEKTLYKGILKAKALVPEYLSVNQHIDQMAYAIDRNHQEDMLRHVFALVPEYIGSLKQEENVDETAKAS